MVGGATGRHSSIPLLYSRLVVEVTQNQVVLVVSYVSMATGFLSKFKLLLSSTDSSGAYLVSR